MLAHKDPRNKSADSITKIPSKIQRIPKQIIAFGAEVEVVVAIAIVAALEITENELLVDKEAKRGGADQ